MMVWHVYNFTFWCFPNEVFLKMLYTEIGAVIVILEEAVQAYKPGTNNIFTTYIA